MVNVRLIATDGVVNSFHPSLRVEIIKDLEELWEWWDERNKDVDDYDGGMMYPIIQAMMHDFQSAAFEQIQIEADKWEQRARELGFTFDSEKHLKLAKEMTAKELAKEAVSMTTT